MHSFTFFSIHDKVELQPSNFEISISARCLIIDFAHNLVVTSLRSPTTNGLKVEINGFHAAIITTKPKELWGRLARTTIPKPVLTALNCYYHRSAHTNCMSEPLRGWITHKQHSFSQKHKGEFYLNQQFYNLTVIGTQIENKWNYKETDEKTMMTVLLTVQIIRLYRTKLRVEIRTYNLS